MSPMLRRKAAGYIRAIQPDLIISVHPLMNDIGMRLMHRAGLRVPFVTVVTDMVTIHPVWIYPKVSFCMVPTEPARQRALKYGIAEEKIMVVGQPVSLKFTQKLADKAVLRQKLGLATDRRTVLLVGGGEGFGRIFDIARAIARRVSVAQLVIVAGRNKILKTQLEEVNWEIPTTIYGFVDNMHEVMGASDILVTKAGPGTISEAFVAGLPLIIFDFIPGQEEGNVSYVKEHGAGAFAQEPEQIASLVREWMDPANRTLQQMQQNASALARPEAALTIARKACDLI
jgi:1,2-diacylglycerol 3-beta-galactosyltransferase